ncbi:MAG: diadenylate cyclase CdaA [Clostridia bacterium]|nr:diadenylate cyclase CdaA [Clostridia bacterium]
MISDFFDKFAANLGDTFSQVSFVDVIDILCVTVILYFVYKFVKDRRAGKLAIGVLLMVFFLFIAELINLHAMQFIFRNIFQVGVLSLVILFQPELRSFLEKVGGGSIKGIRSIAETRDSDSVIRMINEVCQAASDMSDSRTGALIVFERSTKIGEYAATGTIVNADINSLLIKNIFYNKAPLHDGAVIIRKDKIYAAGCVLPLSSQSGLSKNFGTRHRAALGLSENSDAVVLVVSEETGAISLAVKGGITSGYTAVTLKEKLREYLTVNSITETLKTRSRKQKKNKNA